MKNANEKPAPLPNEPKVHVPSQERQLAIRLSNRQYSLLRYLDGAPKKSINVEELSYLNQGTVGANKRRGWLTETTKHDGVQLTYEGKQALQSFEHGDFLRQVARMRFSSFLTLENYEERVKEKKRKAKRAVKEVKPVAKPRTTVREMQDDRRMSAGA